jgi:hypothetical protein
MRGADKLILMVGLIVPLVVAGVGWPLFVRWLGGSSPATSPPETAGAVATAAPVTAAQPTATAILPQAERPTPPADVPTPGRVRPEATRVSQGAQADTGPTAAVATFYALVERHEFDTAAQLWTPRMRAEFPPAENIDHRFAQTEQLRVNRVEVVSARGEEALVGIDLNERSAAGERHYVGTWSVVHSGDTWLLDQPNLEAAP